MREHRRTHRAASAFLSASPQVTRKRRHVRAKSSPRWHDVRIDGRRPIEGIQVLLGLYKAAGARGSFDAGIGAALERVLVSRDFLFRIEADPASATRNTAHRISDVELATRLSFFLWSSIPDDELLDLA